MFPFTVTACTATTRIQGHEIDIVDMAKRAVTGVIDISPYRAPHGIQMAPSGCSTSSAISTAELLVVDPKARKIVAAIDNEGTGHWLAMLPDESKIYVANKNDKPFVSVIDLKARKLVGRIDAPNGTQGITVSPDGRHVIAADFSQPLLLVIDPATDKVVDRVTIKDQKAGGQAVLHTGRQVP